MTHNEAAVVAPYNNGGDDSNFYFDDPVDLAARHSGHACPLAEVAYYGSLYNSIHASAIQRSAEKQTADTALLYAKIVAETEFHDHFDDVIFHQLSSEVFQSISFKRSLGFQTFDSDLHVLLWCAIRSYLDSDSFSSLFNSTSRLIPPCVLSSSLLPLAARSLNDSAVEALLRQSACDPNANGVLFRTLRNLLFVEQDNSRSVLQTRQISWKQRLTNTVRFLLEHGAKLTFESSSSTNSPNQPIFSLVPLASHGLGETIDVMLSAASSNDLNFCPEINSFNGYQPRTALTLALIAFKLRFFVNPVPERLLLSMERQGRNRSILVLKHVILPLLKAGAVLPRDPLNFENSRMDDWFNYYRSLFFLPDYSPSVSEMNDSWVLYYFRLILEARMTSRFDFQVFRRFIEQYRNRWSDRELQFGNFFLTNRSGGEFPRPLQNQCRTFLLSRCLPGGFKERTAAIKSLNLPGCIADYLAFADFDLPVKLLEMKENQQQTS